MASDLLILEAQPSDIPDTKGLAQVIRDFVLTTQNLAG